MQVNFGRPEKEEKNVGQAICTPVTSPEWKR